MEKIFNYRGGTPNEKCLCLFPFFGSLPFWCLLQSINDSSFLLSKKKSVKNCSFLFLSILDKERPQWYPRPHASSQLTGCLQDSRDWLPLAERCWINMGTALTYVSDLVQSDHRVYSSRLHVTQQDFQIGHISWWSRSMFNSEVE